MPCAPDLQADGSGRIGIQIFSNISVDHLKAKDVPDALNLATAEFKRWEVVLYGTVWKLGVCGTVRY